ncbi:Auxin response factor 1 [Artemisia annua]|uniref:Auxin response factor 1 n=1 Tax=Artemisia annua TaxID=35608 RepID=A0A2U1KXX8_ARTAN|nr:Auxin response factor 1 [Artemisia annua]
MEHMAATNYPEGCFLLFLGALINVFAEFSSKAPYECSGPHAYVPCEGENVFYFPQGQLEQIEAPNQQVPAILLPPKIFCKVVNVRLWVENEQVYAQITLLPHQDQSVVIPDLPVPEPPCCNVCSFCKEPTACDASAPGGLRKHTYLSVLATAHHAVTARTRFNVIYRPRATQSAFIISVNRYLKAQNPRPCVGMKFTMGFESERVPEERFGGKIVAVGDDASSTWPDSEWKSVKVQWDKPSTILPDKVSPWELELKPSQRFKGSCCLGLKRLCCCGQKVAY